MIQGLFLGKHLIVVVDMFLFKEKLGAHRVHPSLEPQNTPPLSSSFCDHLPNSFGNRLPLNKWMKERPDYDLPS